MNSIAKFKALKSLSKAEFNAHKAENATEHNTIKTNLTKNTKNIRDIESTLRNVNVNNEAIQEASGYSIFSLPKNASSAKAKVELEGLTLVNSVENGDFSDGNTGWGIGGLGASGAVVNEIYEYTITDNTQLFSRLEYLTDDAIIGDEYFIWLNIKPIHNLTGIYIQFGEVEKPLITATANVWNEIYATLTPSTTTRLRIYPVRSMGDYANEEKVYLDNIIRINKTALGIEDYTEEQMLDLVRSGYIDGLQSVMRPTVESVGKNLESKNLLQSINGDNVYGDKVKVESNKDIYLLQNIDGGHRPLIKLYDNNNNLINSGVTISSYDGAGWVNFGAKYETSIDQSSKNVLVTITANPNICFVEYGLRANSGTIANSTDRLISQTATAYEPYKSSQLTADVPLRRVPNGVADRVYESDGQMWMEKNVEEYVLESGDITGSITTGINVDDVQVTLPSDKATFTSSTTIEGKTLVVGYPEKGYLDSLENVNTHFSGAASQKIEILVPKGTYASLAEAQADLAGTVIQYQLATPELINLTEQGLVSGQLLSQPSGTVYVSDKAYDAGVYDSGITITDTTYPIDEITTLSKVDFETGAETDLDISTAVIAGGGLSFTHPELADGDIVFFGYDFTNGSVPALTTVEYYDSRYVIEDSVTGTFYQWNVTVANGVSSIELVEV
jgi:hypothetical protein